MKKGGLVWFVGLLAFIVVFAAGFAFFFRWFPQFSGALNTIKMVASIVLTVIALVFGWLWLQDTKMNKTAKIVLQVLFIVFAVLAILGYIGF